MVGGRIVALITAGALASGCTTYRGSKDVASLGAGIMGGTLLIGIAVADKDEDVSGREAAEVMVPLILIGLVLATVGVLGMGFHKAAGSDRRDPQIVTEPPPPPPVDPVAERMAAEERSRRAAWDMTQQARTAAAQNDCPRVAYLAARVVELDRPTFDTVFSRDPYIIKCAPANQRPPEPPRSIPIPPLNPPIPPPVPPPAEEPPPATP